MINKVKDSWEERFDKQFGEWNFHHKDIVCFHDYITEHAIKQFIATTRENAVREVLEELVEICNRCKTERGLARAIGNFIKSKMADD